MERLTSASRQSSFTVIKGKSLRSSRRSRAWSVRSAVRKYLLSVGAMGKPPFVVVGKRVRSRTASAGEALHCALVQKRAQPLGWTLFALRAVRNFSRCTCRRKNDPVLSAAWRREMGGHTDPSLHGVGSVQEPAGSGVETDLAPAERDGARPLQGAGAGLRRRGEVTPPYGSNTGGAKQRADVGLGPYGEKGRFPQPPRPAAHSAASAPADARDVWKTEQRSSPKGSSTSDNPSVTAAP